MDVVAKILPRPGEIVYDIISFKNAPCKTRIDQVLNKRYDSPRFIYDNKFEILQLPLPPPTN